ncbi:MAG: amino acid carrier protein [Pseudomonadales bacterium]|jgi:AGCS family alanine or glycine:cation symporter|nr:amino acid carrier protein [Pseudomonadales bacterium]
MEGIDAAVDAVVGPAAALLSRIIFFEVDLFGVGLPLVVAWLVAAGLFFTVYLRGIAVRGFATAVRLVGGRPATPRAGLDGEVSHFQALSTAVSGTVGIGNIGGVAVAISAGGPGAAFWLLVAGILGMATKFAECTLGVRYRRLHGDGSVSGGPMHYLERGLAEIGLARLGRVLAVFYAAGIVIGCMGIGNMFQANQAFVQIVAVTGGDGSPLAGRGWIFGLVLAAVVAVVIIGGIRSIARVTQIVVPFMAILYLGTALTVLAFNAGALPWAIGHMVTNAFTGEAAAGGALGALVIGFQRAAFSNEAGIGSASIAHSAVRTDRPASEGYVALLEPFIDTVVICMATALVIITTRFYLPGFDADIDGIAMTSVAFARVVPFFPPLLAVAAILFAVSTMLAWSYYGLKGFTYLTGPSPRAETGFKLVFCAFIVLGAMIELGSVLSFSDAMVFVICVPNILGLYLLAPKVREEIARFAAGRAA